MNQGLTQRETRIVRMLIAGLLNKEIAFRLGIKEANLKHANFLLFRKLHLRNRTAVAVWGLRNQELLEAAK